MATCRGVRVPVISAPAHRLRNATSVVLTAMVAIDAVPRMLGAMVSRLAPESRPDRSAETVATSPSTVVTSDANAGQRPERPALAARCHREHGRDESGQRAGECCTDAPAGDGDDHEVEGRRQGECDPGTPDGPTHSGRRRVLDQRGAGSSEEGPQVGRLRADDGLPGAGKGRRPRDAGQGLGREGGTWWGGTWWDGPRRSGPRWGTARCGHREVGQPGLVARKEAPQRAQDLAFGGDTAPHAGQRIRRSWAVPATGWVLHAQHAGVSRVAEGTSGQDREGRGATDAWPRRPPAASS